METVSAQAIGRPSRVRGLDVRLDAASPSVRGQTLPRALMAATTLDG